MTATAFNLDEMVEQLRAQGVPLTKAQAAAREALGMPSPESIERSELEISAREKEIEAEGDRIMRALGFDVVRFSHPGPTKQTPGIADRRYRHARRRIALWWEAKAEWGRQSPAQRDFQLTEEACGQTYVLGTHAELLNWLQLHRICRRERDGTITPLPLEDQR
jgi:hypothetical protein